MVGRAAVGSFSTLLEIYISDVGRVPPCDIGGDTARDVAKRSFKDRGQCTMPDCAHFGATWPAEVPHAVCAEVVSLSAIFRPLCAKRLFRSKLLSKNIFRLKKMTRN